MRLDESIHCQRSIKNIEQGETSSPPEGEWKEILGFYILENSLRTDAAFIEISRNLSNRG